MIEVHPYPPDRTGIPYPEPTRRGSDGYPAERNAWVKRRTPASRERSGMMAFSPGHRLWMSRGQPWPWGVRPV